MNDPAHAGFRLERVEVRNWGTFHQRAWVFPIQGLNALLTGNVGTGKSTIIDALTTLLIGSHRVAFNRAAGADTKERTLRSYVLGYFKSERGEISGSRPVGLRDERNAFSAILATFVNAQLQERVTIAQVFWFRDAAQPEKLFVVASSDLSIKADFSEFGTDIGALRKRLRQRTDTEVMTSYSEYAASFRRKMGIIGEHALELFHQTVSMKSVGDLTEFVRTHMLEAAPVAERIDDLLKHFADLDRAHHAVEEARMQIDQLRPLVAAGLAYDDLEKERRVIDGCLAALPSWLATRRVAVIEQRIGELESAIRGYEAELDGFKTKSAALDQERKGLAIAIGQNGGERLREIDLQSEASARERDRCRAELIRLTECCRVAQLPVPTCATAFAALHVDAQRTLNDVHKELGDADNAFTDAQIAWRAAQDREGEIKRELVSLRTRRTNIPASYIEQRRMLMTAIGGVDEDDLPYVAELIQVRDEEADWQGAIERVLYGLGTSMLVQSKHYDAVANWVDRTQLRRFRYYHVNSVRSIRHLGSNRKSLVHKIDIQPSSWARDWVHERLVTTCDYVCCDTLDEFRRERMAVTINGQKKQDQRHEKDDSTSIGDRSRYILGWSNEGKIAAMEEVLEGVRREGTRDLTAAQKADGLRKQLRERERGLQRILEVKRWLDIDVTPHVDSLARLEQERHSIASGSSQLNDLTKLLRAREDEAEALATSTETITGLLATTRQDHKRAQQFHDESIDLRDGFASDAAAVWHPQLEALRGETPETNTLQWDQSDRLAGEWTRRLGTKREHIATHISEIRDNVIGRMGDFRRNWPILSQDLDQNIAALPSYADMLARLEKDDLPRFIQAFREALRDNTINEIVSFQSMLEDHQSSIRNRIMEINASLRDIDYNPGRYIELLATPDLHPEIQDFRRQLRECTEHVVGESDEAYSDTKYKQVRQIIDRFKGREGFSDIDKRWRDLVTDVRNWSRYGASERYRSDNTEYEHYADSSGKSGGQKEKLAYTVLAASIAYRYGLGNDQRRSFRFVVIDEAFGRGSDDSARYGLDLFGRLGLQLLIATPLQKISVIEPYVANVGFVSNDGRESAIRTLTIEEFRSQQLARANA